MQFKTVENYYSPKYSGHEAYKEYIGLKQDIEKTPKDITDLSTLVGESIKRLTTDFTDIENNFWNTIQDLGGGNRIPYSRIIDPSQLEYFFDHRASPAAIFSQLLAIEFNQISRPSDEAATDRLYVWLREQKIISSPTKQATIWDDSYFKNEIKKLYEIDETIVPPELTAILDQIKREAKKYSDLNNLIITINTLRTQIMDLKSKLITDSRTLSYLNFSGDVKEILSDAFKKAINIFRGEIEALTDPLLKDLKRDLEVLCKAMVNSEDKKCSFDDLINDIGSYYAKRFQNYNLDLIVKIKATWIAHQANLELINSKDFTNNVIAENEAEATKAASSNNSEKGSGSTTFNFFSSNKTKRQTFLTNTGYLGQLAKLNNDINFNIENKVLIQTLHGNLETEVNNYMNGTKNLREWQKDSLALIQTHLEIGSELRGYVKPIIQNTLNVLVNILACIAMLIIGYIIYAAIEGPFSPVDLSNETEKLLQATSAFIEKVELDDNNVVAIQAIGSPSTG